MKKAKKLRKEDRRLRIKTEIANLQAEIKERKANISRLRAITGIR